MKKMTPEAIHSRRWATLAVLCLSLLLVVVDSSIVNVALPTLSRALHASTTSLQWITDAYTLAVAGLLLTLGSLGDRMAGTACSRPAWPCSAWDRRWPGCPARPASSSRSGCSWASARPPSCRPRCRS